jgi:predicted nucleotidyltransferase
MTKPVQLFLDQVVGWAQIQPDILAVALVGSVARGTNRIDSDIDLVLIAVDPNSFLIETRWTGQFGEVQRRRVEDYGKLISLRVWYRHGIEVEFGFTTRDWVDLPLDAGTRRVLEDGVKVLYDPQRLFGLRLWD